MNHEGRIILAIFAGAIILGWGVVYFTLKQQGF